MVVKRFDDDAPHLRWMDRLGLALMLVTDLTVGIALVERGWNATAYTFCILYAGGLTYGWWCVRLRPTPEYGLASAVAVVPLLIQAALYTCFWIFLVSADLHAGAPGGLFSGVVFYGTLLAFFVAGPVFGVLLLFTARRPLALFFAEIGGPLLFLVLNEIDA